MCWKNRFLLAVCSGCCLAWLAGPGHADPPADAEASKPRLLALLKDPSPEVRGPAALALGKIGGSDVLEPLLAAARDEHSLVRRYAADGLWMLKDPRAVEPLLALLAEQRGGAQSSIYLALGALKDKRAVDPLIAALGWPGPWYAAGALGEIGDRRAVAPLISLLNHEHDSARFAAVCALVRLGDSAAYPDVVRLLHGSLRDLVVQELAKAGRSAVPALADALEAPDAEIREGAVKTLQRIYGKGFEQGGREWLLWVRQFREAIGSWDDLDAVQSKPATAIGQRKLVRAAALGVPGQVQVIRMASAGDKIIASVRYEKETGSADSQDYQQLPPREIRSALAAWDSSGGLLWKTELPAANHLLVVGNQIVLSYDDGSIHSLRGLIWVDSANGAEVRRIKLPGRPAKLAFNPVSETLVMVMYPQHRLQTTENSWMEVRSYRMDGELAWKHKEPASELDGLQLDGTAVVILSPTGTSPRLAGLDPLSGRVLWQRPYGRFPAVPAAGSQVPRELKGLTCIPCPEGLEFIDPRTGAVRHALPRPRWEPLTPKLCSHAGRVYFMSTQLEGFTLAAMAFPSGTALWADQTATVCYGEPGDWQGNTVFLLRRLSQGLTGHLVLTELRVYSPEGELRTAWIKEKGEPNGLWDDTVAPLAVDTRLYVVEGPRIVALTR